MAPKKKQVKTKVKKKKWVPVMAPAIFNNVMLGETHIIEDGQVTKKRLTLNLMPILNDMRKQSYEASFKIVSLKEGKAQTVLLGLKMVPNAVKRLVRRGRNKIEDSFLAKLKTGQVVRIKPVVVTHTKCSKGAQTEIRSSIKAKVKELLKTTTLDAFAKEVIDNKLGRLLKTISNQHHPTRSVDIKAIVLTTASADALATMDKEDSEPKKDSIKEEFKKESLKKESVKEEKDSKPVVKTTKSDVKVANESSKPADAKAKSDIKAKSDVKSEKND